MNISKHELDKKLSTLLSSGDFQGFKNFVDSKEMELLIECKPNYVMFETACVSGNMELIDYLLTSSDIHPHFQKEFNFTEGFDLFCMTGEFDMVKKLLTYEKINMSKTQYNGLVFAFSKGHKNIIEYLLFSEDLKQHADIHTQKDLIFKTMVTRRYSDMVKYMINDLKIDKNVNIDNLLEENTENNIIIRTMFLERDLNNTSNTAKHQKIKI